MVDHKVIVIGLDGATWDLLTPWTKSGFLPNLQRLVKQGVHGHLQTVHPHSTAPAWSSFATGKNPGKHGVFDFLVPQRSLSQLAPVTAKDIKTETFYELIAREGGRVILINLPVSYPPRLGDKGHVTITSLMTQGEEYVFPPSLKKEFSVLKEYRISPDPEITINGTVQEYIHDIRGLEATRFECAQALFQNKDWDFFFYLISGTDWIQHQLFDHLVAGKLPKDHEALKAYQDFDHYLGWFMDHLPEGAHLVLISDHGFMVRKGFFYLNSWLWGEGYLAVQPSPTERVPIHQVAAERQRAARGKPVSVPAPVAWALCHSPTLNRIVRWFWLWNKRWSPFRVRLSVNTPLPDQSKAFMPLQGTWGIYLNTVEQFSSGLVPTSEYQALRDELVRRLKSLRDPRTSHPIFDWVALREEVYQGPYMEQAPDVLIASRSFQMDSIIPPKSMLFFRRATHNGHSPTGIFAVYGPHTRCGEILRGCQLLDVAPTVLHLMGLPIIEDMDGEVLAKALDPASPTAVRSVKHVAAQWAGTLESLSSPQDEVEVVKKRLRNLGYLD